MSDFLFKLALWHLSWFILSLILGAIYQRFGWVRKTAREERLRQLKQQVQDLEHEIEQEQGWAKPEPLHSRRGDPQLDAATLALVAPGSVGYRPGSPTRNS